MLDAGEMVEGYHTLELLLKYIDAEVKGSLEQLPLLRVIQGALFGGKHPRDELLRFTEQCYAAF
jgi:hypothetical protein